MRFKQTSAKKICSKIHFCFWLGTTECPNGAIKSASDRRPSATVASTFTIAKCSIRPTASTSDNTTATAKFPTVTANTNDHIGRWPSSAGAVGTERNHANQTDQAGTLRFNATNATTATSGASTEFAKHSTAIHSGI